MGNNGQHIHQSMLGLFSGNIFVSNRHHFLTAFEKHTPHWITWSFKNMGVSISPRALAQTPHCKSILSVNFTYER